MAMLPRLATFTIASSPIAIESEERDVPFPVANPADPIPQVFAWKYFVGELNL